MKSENLDWINHIYASNLSSKAKLLGSILGSYMHGSDEAYPGLSRLTFESSLSRRSVQAAIDELEREGWIVKKPGGITATGSLSPNHYHRSWKNGTRTESNLEQDILKNADDPMANTGQSEPKIAIGMATGAIGYGTDCHTLVHQLHPNKIDNKIVNIKHMVIEDDRPNLKPENQALSNDQEYLMPEIQSVSIPDCKTDQAKVIAKEAKEKSKAVNQEADRLFALFWAVWPKRVAKAPARKAWGKLKDQPAILALIKLDLEARAKAGAWDDAKYIPNPATYLNQQRWNDEYHGQQHQTASGSGRPSKYRPIEATLNNLDW